MSDRDSHGSGGQLDLNQLRTFLAVYRTGSFTAAARRLGLSQPTVTAQVRALEQRLGRDLFERQARGAAPLPHAEELAARLADPLDRLAELAGPERAPEPVHLAGPAEFLCTVLLRELAPLAEQGVRLRVVTGLTDPLLEELRAGRHDLVVATGRPRGRSLHAEAFADEEFVLVAAPLWADRLGPATPLTDLPTALEALPLVSYAEDLPIARRYWRHVFDRRLTARAALTVPDLRGVLAAVTAGAGWTVLPSYLCRGELASGALRLLHQPADPPINTAYLVQRPGGSPNPHVALVRERMVAAARTW
ncbi:LysR family transcriptional regulator [Kitasatospora viridis]|uniref:DNA-binding transcriptional LysR family regulator n=1 Tax=Kitasatospora viridis TaxID=281105 RepID=A0A561S9A9_9ACTN|nr:LysR family transcriptional regulator [Kitasatospora viridis]TWF71385.1 DNA-binding transcriptional LysR family regulator [Kitasatospora viridis]